MRGYIVASLLTGVAFAPAFLMYSTDIGVALGLTGFVMAVPALIGLMTLGGHRLRARLEK